MSITAIQSGFGANNTQQVQQGITQVGQQYGGQVTTSGTSYQLQGGGIAGGSLTTPYYGYSSYTTTTSIVIEPDIRLRKVENGWILKMHSKEYVLTETAQVAKYLQLFE